VPDGFPAFTALDAEISEEIGVRIEMPRCCLLVKKLAESLRFAGTR
jgi:hypothetical protein